MANVIAEIRLAPGEVGYYDDYSRIYLNTARPTAQIYAGTNTTQIRKSIRSGRLRLVSGSLNASAKAKEEPAVKPEKITVSEEPEIKTSGKIEIKDKAEPVVEPVAEPVAEPIEVTETVTVEEPVVEAPAKPKRRSRKKQAAETTE